MALKKTKLLDIQSVTGVATVGIFTAGLNSTPVGVASTSYIKSVIMHNTGLGTARASLFIYPNTTSAQRGNPDASLSKNRVMRVDIAPAETVFFESNYPLVLTPYNALAVEVNAPDVGGAGIGSVVNFQVIGDCEIL